MGSHGQSRFQVLRRSDSAARMLTAITASVAILGTGGAVVAHATAATRQSDHAGTPASRMPAAGNLHALMTGAAASSRSRVAFLSATCPSTATIVHSEGTGTVLDFSAKAPAGVPLQGQL